MNPAIVRSYLSSLTLALIITAITSCKKDTTSAFDPNGTKLSKVITTYSFRGSAEYTNIYQFYYDSLNRVIEITASAFDSVKSIKYFYNNNQQRPYKCVDSTSNPTKETYYSYDTNGRIVTDSIFGISVGLNTYALTRYNWSDTRILTSTALPVSNGVAISSDSSFITNNNITAQFGTTGPIGLGMTGFINVYDNKNNPLNTLNIRAVTALRGIGGLVSPGYSKNNIIESRFGSYPLSGTLGFIEQSKTNYSYQYNTAGLPVECEVSGTLVSGMIKYFYTK
ncbi:hypothetical protein [Longitalea arenae]|uniref:hypothetical protein n=1 Tax=Longitalea arenae TaxID=2812558 RepID=UPI001968857D|nr:hypothetical protein [Longitalea arenae]